MKIEPQGSTLGECQFDAIFSGHFPLSEWRIVYRYYRECIINCVSELTAV